MDVPSAMLRVLGAIDLVDRSGTVHPLHGRRLQTLLGVLAVRAGDVVSTDALVDAMWGDDLPDGPDAALQTQVFRLRQRLRAAEGPTIVTHSFGYSLDMGGARIDATEFERKVGAATQVEPARARALLDEALGLWRGPAFAGFEDVEPLHAEQLRLEELRLQAVERRGEAALLDGDPNGAIAALDAFVVQHPLRADGHATLMRALAIAGREAEALRVFEAHRRFLADDLGLEPSSRLRAIEAAVLRGDVRSVADQAAGAALPAGLAAGLRFARLTSNGSDIAWAEAGSGHPVVVIPAWVSNLAALADGRDPRAALIEHLAAVSRAITYDRRGTGMSAGVVEDYGIDGAVAELTAVLGEVGQPAALFAMSGAGPIAVACAALRPDLVSHLVLFGTYANGPATFGAVGRPIVELMRQRPTIATELLAGLYRPGTSGAVSQHMARILRESAPVDVAAGYLEAIYDTDVTDLAGRVRAPTLVLHYRGDRVIPFAGGEALSALVPSARFEAKDGAWHLPDARDVGEIVEAVVALLGS